MKRNALAGIILVILIGGAVAAGLMSKKDPTPIPGNPATEPVESEIGWEMAPVIQFEAEDFEAKDGPIELISAADASGGKALTIPEGPNKTELNPAYKTPEGKPILKGSDFDKSYTGVRLPNGVVTYKFTVEEAGDYYLWARHFWPHSCANGFNYKIDDGETLQYSGDPTRQKWIWARPKKTMGEIHLTKGQHTFVLMNREDGMQVDKFLLTTDDEFVPTGKDGE